MNWYTSFEIQPSPFPIAHKSKILSMGSCFAQTIGQKMLDAKFDVLVNPFGTIFHPLNLSDLLDHALFNDPLDEEGILEMEGLFLHFSTHSDVVGKTAHELKENYDQRLKLCKTYLEQGTHLILTLGTAWIYEHETFGRVANCHKQPQKLFKKSLSKLEDMEMGLWHVLDNFSRVYPNLKIILTVSPVRHIKDGIPENQLSKSMLRVLCANLERRMEAVSYFPAYEIMMDELRDYRFYKTDRIHPTEEAENYIWEKWKSTVFSPETQSKVAEIQKVQLELAHRPFNPESASHQKFLQNLLGKLERLNGEFDFSREIQEIKAKLLVV
ncbi:GSCFA domain-containing protein [Algoriphagus sp.]|uniref:GSCFA domain-containing protein n=1 Tax=Algoriphagus sp. TaxID=1872435 RepID=UPI002724F1E3|nr:GSCFA domain-containing protein [Algoriphagus sp.]MDO8966792.1 GSCFA domain-containing protein [Algoriphagus sp.]MDP3199885.1 GSCFA domain-containing protein [Algoriphagus sp.]